MCDISVCVPVCVCVKDWASCVGEQAARIAVEASLPHTTAMCAPLDRLSTPQSPLYFSPLSSPHPTPLLLSPAVPTGAVCLLFAHAFGIDFYAVIIFSKRLTMSLNRGCVSGWDWGWGCCGGAVVATVCEARGGASCCRGRVQCLFFPRELHQQQQWSVANTLEKI